MRSSLIPVRESVREVGESKDHINSVKSLRKMTQLQSQPTNASLFDRAANSTRLLKGAGTTEEAAMEKSSFTTTRGKKTKEAESSKN